MKTSTFIFRRKASAFLGAAAVLLAAVFTAGCKTDASEPAPETFTVTFSEEGGWWNSKGSLKAEANGKQLSSDEKVVKGTIVTFTATPNADYQADKWTVTPSDALQEGGKDGSMTAKVKITADTTVSVSFKRIEFTVEMMHGEHGTLKAKGDWGEITSGKKVAKGTTVTFTALPDADYQAKWTISGGQTISGGEDGNETAKVKITADTKVDVSFEALPPSPDGYVRVYFGEKGAVLAHYLKNTASSTDVNKVEVLGLTAADLKGGYSSDTKEIEASLLGSILKAAPDKMVALKFGGNISGLTYMAYCFKGCTNLTQAPEIPVGVTNMNSCFEGCTGLTQAPAIPAGVTDMGRCFTDCEKLTQAPGIPASVRNMSYCFKGCASLVQAPTIPTRVTSMFNCFKGCTSLTQAPAIPANVENMNSCFYGCAGLTRAPIIPASVTDMRYCFCNCKKLTYVVLECDYKYDRFNLAFSGCSSLTAGSIKVPKKAYPFYLLHVDEMDAQKEWFTASY